MNATLQLTLSMVIFGTIGIFRRAIPLPSSLVAMTRGLAGAAFLLVLLRLRGIRLNGAAIRKKLGLLCLSGAAMGVNWILLFEAYNYTSVATATLCYYLMPMFVILASPMLLKEKLSARKLTCVAVALVGMVFVSGILNAGFSGVSEIRGVLLGLAAAAFYAGVVLMNKALGDVPALDRSIVQLGAAGVVLLPYVLLTEDLTALRFAPTTLCMLAIVCILHTGVAYALYFGSLMHLKAQTAAMLSYIDPVVAVLLSSLLLKERLGLMGGVGAVLVLGAAMASEMPEKERK